MPHIQGKVRQALRRAPHWAVIAALALLLALPLPTSAAPALQASPPPNDNFADAIPIGSIPFESTLSLEGTTAEAGEVVPSCLAYNVQTMWYVFAPAEDTTVSLALDSQAPGDLFAVYEGTSATQLQEVGCSFAISVLSFSAEAGKMYYIQILNGYGYGSMLTLRAYPPAPPEIIAFDISPVSSTYAPTSFFGWAWDPAGLGIVDELRWDFGDGESAVVANSQIAYHTYAQEGEYTVTLTAMTVDGRSVSQTAQVLVENHDVAITKFTVPQSAWAGQTQRISVGIKNKLREERVVVSLYSSVPGIGDGFQYVGSLSQIVPVHSGNRTTPFDFSYTFSAEDAQRGKTTFKAVAELVGEIDVLPADNTAISLPVKVGGAQVNTAGDTSAVESGQLFIPLVMSE